MDVLSLQMRHARLLDPMLRVLGVVACLFACGCQSTSTPVPASGNADSGDRADSTSYVDGPGTDGAEVEGSIAEAGLFDSEADTSSHDGGMMQGTTCSMPYDCVGAKVSSACCFDNTCVPVSVFDCGDAGAQQILAMSYDQSCAIDSDCVAIAEGNGACPRALCTNAAINKGDYARYKSDTAKTRGASCFVLSGCVAEPFPCCRAGTCHADFGSCGFGSVPDAAADAGSD
jgi:hypothetical protein